jgi:hypothetical protein
MRFHLYLASYLVVAALLLSATMPGGLSLCVQQSGKASVGLGCTCLDCADQQAAGAEAAEPACCQRCDSGAVINSRCCTCGKLPVVASAITINHDLRLKLASAPALRPPAVYSAVLTPASQLQQTLAALDLPPPRSSPTVLRL